MNDEGIKNFDFNNPFLTKESSIQKCIDFEAPTKNRMSKPERNRWLIGLYYLYMIIMKKILNADRQ